MNIRQLLKPALISIIPAFLLVVNISDIITVFKTPSAYAFGNNFFETASIYSSKETYLAYSFTFSIILLLIIYFAFARKTKALLFSVVLGFMFFLYPLMTGEH